MNRTDSAKTEATIREEDAARAALAGTRAERAKIAARALRNLLRDPDDTKQVFLLGLVANAARYPRLFAKFATSAEGAALLRERPAIDGKALAELRKMPPETLGGAYARYLDDNGLDPDLFRAPPGLPPDAAYLAQRMRQTHDVWHVLTGYRPDVPGEVALQGFTYGQTGMPSAGLIALAGCLKWARKRSGLARMTWDGYRRGKKAAFLPSVRWEELWGERVEEVRRRLGIEGARA